MTTNWKEHLAVLPSPSLTVQVTSLTGPGGNRPLSSTGLPSESSHGKLTMGERKRESKEASTGSGEEGEVAEERG